MPCSAVQLSNATATGTNLAILEAILAWSRETWPIDRRFVRLGIFQLSAARSFFPSCQLRGKGNLTAHTGLDYERSGESEDGILRFSNAFSMSLGVQCTRIVSRDRRGPQKERWSNLWGYMGVSLTSLKHFKHDQSAYRAGGVVPVDHQPACTQVIGMQYYLKLL